MQYDVFVQGKHYKLIEAANTGDALRAVALDIADGLVPDFDAEKNHDIQIVPISGDN